MNRHWHIEPLRRVLGWLVAALLVAASLGTGLSVEDVGKVAPVGAPLEGSREQILKAHANLPLAFVENRGQTDARVRYSAQGSRYAFYLTREEIVLVLVKGSDASSDARGSTLGGRGLGPRTIATTAAADEPATRGVTLALRFLGGNPRVVVEAEERVPGEVNYFRGNAPARWHTHLPRYLQVVYCELWPGVDLRLRGQSGELKYEFRVRPGARLADIRLAYAGAATLTVTPTSTGTLPAPTLVSPAADARFSPGQAITFDWSDVTGAASYTIQIDDANTFSTPLIISQSVTASQYTNSTLQTRRLWWRVRANDAAGNAGAWSAVRRFEVKN